MPFIIVVILITFHEIGHFITAKYLGFDINKIYIYPYGGISKFNMDMNVSLKKELLVLTMGPLLQELVYYILINVSFFSNYTNFIFNINYSILFFNFLPIYPLDGGKLLNILLNYKFNFNTSFKIIIIISYLTVILLGTYYFFSSLSLGAIFMLLFLIYKINDENKNKKEYYNRFLLERYLKKYYFKKKKTINSINNFYRDCSHIIKIDNHYYTEQNILRKKFDTKY